MTADWLTWLPSMAVAGSVALLGLALGFLISLGRLRSLRNLVEAQSAICEARFRKLESQLDRSAEDGSRQIRQIRGALLQLGLHTGQGASSVERSSKFSIDKKHQVISLAEKGLDAQEICRRLHVNRGETELYLDLREYVRAVEKGNHQQNL